MLPCLRYIKGFILCSLSQILYTNMCTFCALVRGIDEDFRAELDRPSKYLLMCFFSLSNLNEKYPNQDLFHSLAESNWSIAPFDISLYIRILM